MTIIRQSAGCCIYHSTIKPYKDIYQSATPQLMTSRFWSSHGGSSTTWWWPGTPLTPYASGMAQAAQVVNTRQLSTRQWTVGIHHAWGGYGAPAVDRAVVHSAFKSNHDSSFQCVCTWVLTCQESTTGMPGSHLYKRAMLQRQHIFIMACSDSDLQASSVGI